MPTCDLCEKMDATVNLRRRKPPHTGHWLCKDKLVCKQRIADRKALIKALDGHKENHGQS